METVLPGVVDATRGAVEFALAHPAAVVFGVLFAIAVAALTHAMLASDRRPMVTLNSRLADEADKAREVTR